MSYIAENIDPEKFEAGLKNNRKYQEELHREAIKRATAEFQGYCKCLEEVREMLHCSNYESNGKETVVYQEGADAAFYELCKELDIGCQDIRDKNISIDQKAYMIAEKIEEILCDKTPGKINWVGVDKAPELLGEHVGKEFVRVIVWGETGVQEAVYDTKANIFRHASVYFTEEVKGVTHWAIFERPQKEKTGSIETAVEMEENNGVD